MTSLLVLKSMLFPKLNKAKRKKVKRKIKSTSMKCRFCYEDKAVIPIYNNALFPNIAQEIKHFTGVVITPLDRSKHMCQDCLDLLNGCIVFRDICQRTNKVFAEALPTLATPSNPIQDMKLEPATIKEESTSPDPIRTRDTDVKDVSWSDEEYSPPSPAPSDAGLESWSCPTCALDFKDSDTYHNHVMRCEVKEPEKEKSPPAAAPKGRSRRFLCETCGKTTTAYASLLTHMITHDNVFPHACDACPYRGRTADLLRVHRRSHLADKPFKCSQCPKATTTSSNLAKHTRHVHSTMRPFKCLYCDKMFSYQHDMKRHVRDIHLRQGTVECDICFKKFNTKKILQGHKLKIHKIRSERSGRLPSYLLCQMEGTVAE